jgi:voltage-gated potassium channel Kch
MPPVHTAALVGRHQRHLDQEKKRRFLDDHEAALKIQSCWRGKKSREAVKKRRIQQKSKKPWGFYTHSLSLTTKQAHALLDLASPSSTRRWVWLLIEEPTSSNVAQAISIFIIGLIICSIAGFILETAPEFYRASPAAFNVLEVTCTAAFTLEYFVRLAVCNEGSISHISFMIAPMNIFDLMAVVPFYVELVLGSLGHEDTPALRVFRLVRLVRVIRIFKLGRYATGMRLFGEALAGSTTAISVLIFLLCMGVVLFSSALFHVEKMSCPEIEQLRPSEAKVYHAECRDDFNRGYSPSYGLCCTEENSPNDFPSIISTFWWSLVTMTSVGYGEIYPRTTLGKCVGFIAMLVGMVLIALPVAIVGQKFQDVYDNHDLEEAKRRAAVRMKVMGEVWSLVPASEVVPKLRKLEVKDPALSSAIAGLSSRLEEVWEQREQLMRERQYEADRQEEVHQKVGRLLNSMEAVLDGRSSSSDW